MKDLTLPPLPEIPKSEIIPYSAIRYVAGYTESFVHKYAQDYARAALSHHEDGGGAEPVWCSCGDAIMPDTGAKCGVCASGVALGGEKGEAVADEKLNELLDAYAEIAHQNGVEFCAGNEGDLEGELTAKRAVLALFAAPVGKARMLTDEEADHITGMHNTGRSQGDSECAEAIQRKFCEVNGITLEAK